MKLECIEDYSPWNRENSDERTRRELVVEEPSVRLNDLEMKTKKKIHIEGSPDHEERMNKINDEVKLQLDQIKGMQNLKKKKWKTCC